MGTMRNYYYRENWMMLCYLLWAVFAAGAALDSGLDFRQTELVQTDAEPGAETGRGTGTEAGKNADEEAPRVALTFDDGPSEACTPVLLDGLKERGVKASFFLIGKSASEHPELVKRMYEEGHLIGNHTYHHVQLTSMPREKAIEEIDKTNQILKRITGETAEYVRPPFGEWQKGMEEELGVVSVLWSVDPLDWTTQNADEIVNKVVTGIEENDIILLHDCYDSSVKAALRIVDLLQKKGFEFVTVDELLMN